MRDSMGRIEIDRTIHARDWTEGYRKGWEEGIDAACEAIEPLHEGEWLPCTRAVELIREAGQRKGKF